jgi:hypothetical protein
MAAGEGPHSTTTADGDDEPELPPLGTVLTVDWGSAWGKVKGRVVRRDAAQANVWLHYDGDDKEYPDPVDIRRMVQEVADGWAKVVDGWPAARPTAAPPPDEEMAAACAEVPPSQVPLPQGLLQAVFAELRPPDAIAPEATAVESAEQRDSARVRHRSPSPTDATTSDCWRLPGIPDLARFADGTVIRYADGAAVRGPRLSQDFLMEFLQRHDIVEQTFRWGGGGALNRGDLMRLAFTCREVRRLVVGPAVRGGCSLLGAAGPLGIRAPLGLFATPFGRENGCQLFEHQHRSLRVMQAAEQPPGWEFGQLRGGILADDPGLGKTVTMLALVVDSVGTLPQTPTEFYNRIQMEADWPQQKRNPQLEQNVLKHLVNPLRSLHVDMARLWNPARGTGHPLEHHPTFQALEAELARSVRATVESVRSHEVARRPRPPHAGAGGGDDGGGSGDGGAGSAADLQRQLNWLRQVKEAARTGINVVRSGLDKRGRAFSCSPAGKRVLFERNVLPAATTLVIVPSALLEHWVEQFVRHVDLRAITRLGDRAHRHRCGGEGDAERGACFLFAHSCRVVATGCPTPPVADFVVPWDNIHLLHLMHFTPQTLHTRDTPPDSTL